jgi:retron-type reverse transcriptase
MVYGAPCKAYFVDIGRRRSALSLQGPWRPVSFLYLRSKSTKGSVAEMRVEKHLVKPSNRRLAPPRPAREIKVGTNEDNELDYVVAERHDSLSQRVMAWTRNGSGGAYNIRAIQAIANAPSASVRHEVQIYTTRAFTTNGDNQAKSGEYAITGSASLDNEKVDRAAVVGGEGNRPSQELKGGSHESMAEGAASPQPDFWKCRPKLETLLRERNVHGKYCNLIEVVSDVSFLIYCYELIRGNPGNMTPGLDGATLDGLTINWFSKLSQQLQAGQFEFKPLLPYLIASPRDKIVQKALTVVLDSIYDPEFLDCSHGFRSSRGAKRAILQVDRTFKSATWVIEGDITKCSASLPHKVILGILEEEIACRKFMSLVRKSLSVGYVDEKGKRHHPNIGTPQALTFLRAPLLCNITLHQLDKYISSTLKEQYDKHEVADASRLIYRQRSCERLYRRAKYRGQPPGCGSHGAMDPNFRRLSYVRYADDFVIGITGPKTDAIEIRDLISTFLSTLGLELNKEKTKISHIVDSGFFFLGTQIFRLARGGAKRAPRGRRRVTPRLVLHAPIRKLLSTLREQGFLKGDFRPTAKRGIVPMDHADILRFYNQKILGILNYYSFVDNRSSLWSIVHLMKESCALTLALKYRTKFKRSTLNKFGPQFQCAETGVVLYKPTSFSRTTKLIE